MKKLISMLSIVALLASCQKSNNLSNDGPWTSLQGINGLAATCDVGQKLILKTVPDATKDVAVSWFVEQEQVSDQPVLEYQFAKSGEYTVTVKVIVKGVEEIVQQKICVIRGLSENSSKWISSIIEYRPAPGQFVNTSQGDETAAASIVGKKGLVSLGNFGGYVDFQFDHSVINKEGYDFAIHGNAFKGSSEAGIVMVAFDKNGNGKPDSDQWYELKGGDDQKSTKNYEITYFQPKQVVLAENVRWVANGVEGFVNSNSFHNQCYYPLFISGSPIELSFKGTLLPNNWVLENGIYVLKPFESGYADNFSAEYMTVVNDDKDSQRTNKFDISNAISSDGKSVKIAAIDFVRVYSGLNQNVPAIGESSTDVCGAISFTAKK